MRIDTINKCRICGNADLIEVFDLGTHVLSGRFPWPSEADPLSAPLVLVKCNDLNKESCGLLQLKHTVSGEELFGNEYGYRSGINRTMTLHLRKIVNEIESRIDLKPGDVVLDIGSNDATLLHSYSVQDIKKFGIDPSGEQFRHFYKDSVLVPDFFTIDNFQNVSNKKAKSISSIAMFYDLPEPMKFVEDIKKALHPDGIWTFEQSYMPSMLKTNAFDTICHEHLEYYTLKQINWMLSKNNLKVLNVDFNDINGGSFRVTACHANADFRINESVGEIISNEHKLSLNTMEPYQSFVERVNNLKIKLCEFLKKEKESGKLIHIYGASTKGNTLLQYYGIDHRLIKAAAERNPEKYGKWTPLTHIPIISETESRKANPDYFLVLPWHFKKEFLKRESEFLNKGGKFIFPLPEFEVVGND